MVNSKVASSHEMPKCLICSQPASKRCSGCHEANYCSGDHQRQHWKVHKKSCIPYEVTATEEQGRHLIASRDLKENTVLIQEAPLAFAPVDIETSTSSLVHLCLGCCVQLPPNDSNRCPKCRWPLCSPVCDKIKFHEDMECPIFASKSVHFPPKKAGAIYSSVLILRLLLQKLKNPAQWKKVLELNCQNKIQENRYKQKRENEMILENLHEFYSSEEDLYQVLSKEELLSLMACVNLNSFVVSRQDDVKKCSIHFRGIYSKISLASHGCVPNTVYTLSSSNNFEIILRTSVPVQKGEAIQYLRDDRWVFLGTYQRQVSKLDDKCQFACHCSRCVDPTELGTYLSAIKCTASCSPEKYLLPENPLDLNAEAFWICNGAGCRNSEEQEKIMSILHYFEIDMEKSIARIHQSDGSSLRDKLQKLDELYEQYCKSQLHENHFIVRAIQREFVHIAMPSLTELNFQFLDKLMFHLEKLMDVATILIPGSNHFATLKLYLCQAMLRKKQKAAKEAKSVDVFGTKEHMLEYLTRLDKIQKETLEHFERDAQCQFGSISTNKAQNLIVKQLREDNAIVMRDMKVTLSHLLK